RPAAPRRRRPRSTPATTERGTGATRPRPPSPLVRTWPSAGGRIGHVRQLPGRGACPRRGTAPAWLDRGRTMSHIPVNHPLQPFYRVLGGLSGLFVLVFGIVGLERTAGDPLFERGDATVFGLHLNLAFAIISIVVGLVLVLGAAYGRNVDHYINL